MSALGPALRRPATWPRRRPPATARRLLDAARHLVGNVVMSDHPALLALARSKTRDAVEELERRRLL